MRRQGQNVVNYVDADIVLACNIVLTNECLPFYANGDRRLVCDVLL